MPKRDMARREREKERERDCDNNHVLFTRVNHRFSCREKNKKSHQLGARYVSSHVSAIDRSAFHLTLELKAQIAADDPELDRLSRDNVQHAPDDAFNAIDHYHEDDARYL